MRQPDLRVNQIHDLNATTPAPNALPSSSNRCSTKCRATATHYLPEQNRRPKRHTRPVRSEPESVPAFHSLCCDGMSSRPRPSIQTSGATVSAQLLKSRCSIVNVITNRVWFSRQTVRIPSRPPTSSTSYDIVVNNAAAANYRQLMMCGCQHRRFPGSAPCMRCRRRPCRVQASLRRQCDRGVRPSRRRPS